MTSPALQDDSNTSSSQAGSLTVVHSSDLHIGGHRDEAFHPLCDVVRKAQELNASVLLLAGDVFDSNRMPLEVLDGAARVMGDAGLRVVILPGNHDCLGADSVYRGGGIGEVPNVAVIGVTHEESIVIRGLDIEIWGKAHFDYQNMSPLDTPRSRAARWQIAVAHGHWARGPADAHRSWLITDDQIAATGADYVALGHWPQAGGAGDGRVPAFYSGSPDLAQTVNVVRMADGQVTVRRSAIKSDSA